MMRMYFDFGKKYTMQEIKDLSLLNDETSINYENFINSLVTKMQKDIDDMWFKFLTKNGYKIAIPYDLKQLQDIKEDLAKKDKFLDYLEYTEFSENGQKVTHHLLPFFNCLSNPLSEDDRNMLLENWKGVEENKK